MNCVENFRWQSKLLLRLAKCDGMINKREQYVKRMVERKSLTILSAFATFFCIYLKFCYIYYLFPLLVLAATLLICPPVPPPLPSALKRRSRQQRTRSLR